MFENPKASCQTSTPPRYKTMELTVPQLDLAMPFTGITQRLKEMGGKNDVFKLSLSVHSLFCPLLYHPQMSSTDKQQVTMPDVLKTEAIPEDPNKQKMSELPKNDNKPVLLIKDKKTAAQKKKKKKPEIPRRKKKKPDDSGKPVPLNLNDEVVRMRKEVKRVRALVIRKLTRQMAGLKKKKGKEEDLERNRRRVGRLLEEIHAMKTLKPDPVGASSPITSYLHYYYYYDFLIWDTV